jgi:hypothetical protein
VQVDHVTGEHPYKVAGGEFVVVDLLEPGVVLEGYEGLLRLTGKTLVQGDFLVYNLSVEGVETFFVGGVGSWVHNCFAADVARRALDHHSVDWHHIINGSRRTGNKWNSASYHGWGRIFKNMPPSKEQLKPVLQHVLETGTKTSRPGSSAFIVKGRYKGQLVEVRGWQNPTNMSDVRVSDAWVDIGVQ